MDDNDRLITLKEKELRGVVREEFDNALTRLGVDVSQPLEMQADMRWVRVARQTAGDIRRKVFMVVVGTMATAALGMFWFGFKESVRAEETPPKMQRFFSVDKDNG